MPVPARVRVGVVVVDGFARVAVWAVNVVLDVNVVVRGWYGGLVCWLRRASWW